MAECVASGSPNAPTNARTKSSLRIVSPLLVRSSFSLVRGEWQRGRWQVLVYTPSDPRVKRGGRPESTGRPIFTPKSEQRRGISGSGRTILPFAPDHVPDGEGRSRKGQID